jgi:hypothetical protein
MANVTKTKNCVECGALTVQYAVDTGHTFEVASLPRKRGQTCEGWRGYTCRKTSTVLVTATKIERDPWSAVEWDFEDYGVEHVD